MAELKALADIIRQNADRQAISRLGYFCAPFRAPEGAFAGKVIKVYRGVSDTAALDRLVRCHDDYVAALTRTGVPVPETAIHRVQMDGSVVPVIVQDGLPDASMMRPQMQAGDLDTTLDLMERAGWVIAAFWNNADQFETRIGFHPSIRNFAVHEGRAVFFDTFPPLIHYSRDEMGQILLQFSESRLIRAVGPVFRAKVTGIQDEWYSPSETLVGLVGSACRLRPEHAAAYLDWGRDFVAREMPRWADEAIEGLSRPPRLPGYWTGFRKLLGLQGEPNI